MIPFNRAASRIKSAPPSELGTDFKTFKRFYPDTPTDVRDALELAKDPEIDIKLEEANKQIAAMESADKCITKHKAEYRAYVLSARIIAGAYENAKAIEKAYNTYLQATIERDRKIPLLDVVKILEDALADVKELKDDIASLAAAASAEWDRTRYSRDTKKDISSPYMMARSFISVLANLTQSKGFLDNLSRGFEKAVGIYRKGGSFPGGH